MIEGMKKRLICTVGLPRSGKSTWAKKQPYPVVSSDAVRKNLYGQAFWGPGEKMVWALIDLMVRSLFDSGEKTVILDACNVNYWTRQEWASEEWDTVFKYIDTSKEVCKQRALDGGQPELVSLIDGMAVTLQPPEGPDEQLYLEDEEES